MSWLTDGELASIRADVAELLPSTCNLLAATSQSDGMGGFTITWGTAAANVSCRLDAYRGAEQVTAQALQPYHTFVLTLPHDTTITEHYRVEIGTVTYTVQSVDAVKSWRASVRAYVEKI